ncbi:hypothetical protein [Mesorhizobium sp. M0118]|uniref:hypothetical protein n=1 Tax=Mesorhizobium sp. M0118 TaxID=2956884 RepID=UPI00333D326B
MDGQPIAAFEADLSNNLYKLWNPMSSGSYFRPPMRPADIPKDDGKTGPLRIPTVADRVAQMVVKRFLEALFEPEFRKDSYEYRPGKSAIDAVGMARQRWWCHAWVLDLDMHSRRLLALVAVPGGIAISTRERAISTCPNVVDFKQL